MYNLNIQALCDETTDVSITKHYARYVLDGELMVRYVKIQHLRDGTAETIEQTLLAICRHASIDVCKVVGLGSNGASVTV